MSLLMRFPTRRGRQAEGPKHPDDEKACGFARGLSGVPEPKRPVQPHRSRPALWLSVHSADINGPDAPAPSGDRWNAAVLPRRAAPIRG